MPRRRQLGLLVLVLLGAAPPLRADGPADPLAVLEPYRELVKRCQQWHSRARDLEWKVVCRSDFTKQPERWPKVHQWAKVETVNGNAELHLTPPGNTNMAVPIGPTVSGEFAIETTCRADGDGGNPLSIMTGAMRGSGPAFQFNLLYSKGHCLWREPTDIDQPTEKFDRQMIGNQPRLVPGQAYTLRLEVRKQEIVAYLDGKRFAAAPVSKFYDWHRQYQPHALTVGPTMAIERWRVETYAPRQDAQAQLTDAQRWKQVFGDTTRQQVEARIAELVQQLDHDAWVVREAAAGLVRRAGAFAGPALRKAAKSGSPELVMRAESLLRFLPEPAPEPDAPSPPGPTP